MTDEAKKKGPYLAVAFALIIVFFWWPRTVRLLIIDMAVIAVCVVLAILARRES